jgi:hypothetical protein
MQIFNREGIQIFRVIVDGWLFQCELEETNDPYFPIRPNYHSVKCFTEHVDKGMQEFPLNLGEKLGAWNDLSVAVQSVIYV